MNAAHHRLSDCMSPHQPHRAFFFVRARVALGCESEQSNCKKSTCHHLFSLLVVHLLVHPPLAQGSVDFAQESKLKQQANSTERGVTNGCCTYVLHILVLLFVVLCSECPVANRDHTQRVTHTAL